MVNYFRQLTLPWLIALIAMGGFTGLWYQYEAKTQQRMQITQFAATLQLSIRPLLKGADPQWLKAQLNHISYSSGLAVKAIALYDQNNSLVLATQELDVLQQFTPPQEVSRFTLLSYDGQWLAIQPVAEPDALAGIALRAAERYYLVLVVDDELAYDIWLVPILIVGLIGGMVLLLWQHTLSQYSQRLHTDLSLLTHKLNQLHHGQANVRVDDELVAELAPLQHGLNELVQLQADQQQQLQQAQQQQQQLTAQLQQQHDTLQQQLQTLQQQYQQSQQGVQAQLHNIRQLLQQQHELSEDIFAHQLTAQLFLLQLPVSVAVSGKTPLILTDIVAEQLPYLQSMLADRNITLQLFEGADNPCYEVAFCRQTLDALLDALIQLGCRSPAVTEISMKIQLLAAPEMLQLSISCNGDGVPARVRQLLQDADTASLPWHDSDIAIVAALQRHLNATLAIQSLEGLGCTLELTVPVGAVSPLTFSRLQHVLLFDSQIASLHERGKSLTAIAVHVAKCSDLSELIMKSKQYIYERAIVFLPEPSQMALWHDALHQLNSRGRLLSYAAATQQPVWQEALQLPVIAAPFHLAQLADGALSTAGWPKLLVVDDNPTNLAFVRVLFKQQPVQLHTVTCGADALALCRQQRFDVILLDIQLPDIAGTEVARQLRQLTDYQHTPILAFTAHALEEEVQTFLQAGMNDVILKPLEAAKLEQILRWCVSAGKTDSVAQ